MSKQELTMEQANSLVEQLQQAHRFAVGFYRRILPTLDMVANELGCEFMSWGPLHTSRPPGYRTQPSKNWAWDFVPLFASSHTYKNAIEGDQAGSEDFAIRFYLYIEDTFVPKKRTVRGQPDPIRMPDGQALLRAELYRPTVTANESFDDLWDEDQEHDAEIGTWKPVSPHWEGIAFEWLLAQVICDTQPIIDELKKNVSGTQ